MKIHQLISITPSQKTMPSVAHSNTYYNNVNIEDKPEYDKFYTSPQFKGSKETFLKAYSKHYKTSFLETVQNILKDNTNYLGEGYFKKGFNFPLLDNYIIRVYKHSKHESSKISGPKDLLDKLNGVCFKYGDIFDVVRRKTGSSLGLNNYGQILKDNRQIERSETLGLLETYKKMAEFPLSSYVNLAKQMVKINNSKTCQFDFINPTNILVDLNQKKITAIDPISQFENQYIYKIDNAQDVIGSDSLYFVLCDTCLHEKHIENLNKEELEEWDKAIRKIIYKSVAAGEKLHLPRNIDKLKYMHKSQDEFHHFDLFMPKIEYFLKRYKSAIKENEYIEYVLNPENNDTQRCEVLKNINNPDFNAVKPVFEELLTAPRTVKGESPKLLNITLDKISTYGKDAKKIIPNLENLFNIEIFPPTKKKLYDLFINLEPNNSKFINEITKETSNFISKNYFKEELLRLYENKDKLNTKNKKLVENLDLKEENLDLKKKIFDSSLLNKLSLSRTCITNDINQPQVIKNMLEVNDYISGINEGYRPSLKDLEKIHKILFKDLPYADDIAGKYRAQGKNPYKDLLFKTYTINDKSILEYPRSSEVAKEMDKIQEYFTQNYDTMEPFLFAAKIHKKVIKTHPFYNGNGRAARAFTELILRSRGIKLNSYPENLLYNSATTAEEQAIGLKHCAE